MRWLFFSIIALLMGLQSLRAEDQGVRVETRFLRIACLQGATELSSAYFPGAFSLDEAQQREGARFRKFQDRCERKARGSRVQYVARFEQTTESLGHLNSPCREEFDCKEALSCHPDTHRCSPDLRISNLPLIH